MPDPTPGPESLAAGHETDHFRVRPFLIFIIIFILICALSFLAVHVLQTQLVKSSTAINPQPSPLAESQAPPEPRLQPSPAHPATEGQDAQSLRAKQEVLLNSTGPLPNDPAHIHIPITRAMQLYAKEQNP